MKTKHPFVTVLKGGPSAEREVSLRSGTAVAQALKQAGFEVAEVVVEDEHFELPPQTEIACICLHGTFGEDGQVQAILEARGVLYTGSGVEASRIAFDKTAAKKLFLKHKISTPVSQMWTPGQKLDLALPVVVKPSCQGSSVGVTRVFEASQLQPALDLAARYDENVLVETFIEGREMTVGILGNRALPVIEIVVKERFYDYQNKYTPGGSEHLCPAPISSEVTRKVQEQALAAHRALGCEVYSRVDVMLDAQEQPWVLEVNTIPGMTATSLLPDAARATGMEFSQLCEEIICLSMQARPGKSRNPKEITA